MTSPNRGVGEIRPRVFFAKNVRVTTGQNAGERLTEETSPEETSEWPNP